MIFQSVVAAHCQSLQIYFFFPSTNEFCNLLVYNLKIIYETFIGINALI